jgi:tetratricopeptide (TPR) repeat protein
VNDVAPHGADEDGLLYARVLTELGELDQAEAEVLRLLAIDAGDLTALNLYAKIKHTRGELSEAIACWTRIHSCARHFERATPLFHALLGLVADPERGVATLAAAGAETGVDAPLMELAPAFHFLLSRRPAEARTCCEHLATRKKDEPGVYKMAVLAGAWIAEVAGDLPAARATLEHLGKERGFERDVDRVLALARVYEKIGTTPLLEAALRIYRLLAESYGKLFALGKVALLHRRLGDTASAALTETQHLIAFAQRMHRLSRDDVVRVASIHHLELGRLRQMRLTPHVDRGSDAETSTRARALRAFLEHDAGTAMRLFAQGESLLDRKYLAQLAILEGERRTGVCAAAALVAQDAGDARLLGLLLDQYAAHGDAEIADALRAAEVRERALLTLETAARSSPRHAGVWRNMATLLHLLGRPGASTRSADRAAALDSADQRGRGAVGRVLAAAVLHLPCGKAKGIIHEIWAERALASPGRGGALAVDDIFGNLTPEMKQAVRSTFFAVREYARARFPHLTADIMEYAYAFKITKEDQASSGLSAGLPTAVAFLSVFLQRPVPQDTAFSGVLVADAHDALAVRPVGEAEHKVKSAYQRNLQLLVLPAENESMLKESAEVPPAIAGELVRYARNLNEAVALTFGEDVWIT